MFFCFVSSGVKLYDLPLAQCFFLDAYCLINIEGSNDVLVAFRQTRGLGLRLNAVRQPILVPAFFICLFIFCSLRTWGTNWVPTSWGGKRAVSWPPNCAPGPSRMTNNVLTLFCTRNDRTLTPKHVNITLLRYVCVSGRRIGGSKNVISTLEYQK